MTMVVMIEMMIEMIEMMTETKTCAYGGIVAWSRHGGVVVVVQEARMSLGRRRESIS